MTQNITSETVEHVESQVREWVETELIGQSERSLYVKSGKMEDDVDVNPPVLAESLTKIEWLEEWSQSSRGGTTYRVIPDLM